METYIDTQEHEVYIATNTGWEKVVGHIVNIYDLKFTIHPRFSQGKEFGTYSIVISEEKSGMRVDTISVEVDKWEYMLTKEGYLSYLKEDIVNRIKNIISLVGVELITQQSQKQLKAMEEEHGKRPESKLFMMK